MLRYHAIWLAHENKPDEALRACRTAISVSRVFGDDPFLISVLVRVAGRIGTLNALERVLAQCEPSEAALAKLQKMLEQEVDVPLLYYAMRGERAFMDHWFRAYDAGRVSEAEFTRTVTVTRKLIGEQPVYGFLNRLIYYYEVGSIPKNRAALLRMHNWAVEIAKLPPDEQRHEVAKLESDFRSQPFLVRQYFPALTKVSEANIRQIASMRCMIAILAAERFRRANRRWPATLAELVPTFLSKVPVDPFNKAPLTLKRLPDGLLIYSVGFDGTDSGGILFGRGGKNMTGADYGYQLWDADKRRQPPAVLPPAGSTP